MIELSLKDRAIQMLNDLGSARRVATALSISYGKARKLLQDAPPALPEFAPTIARTCPCCFGSNVIICNRLVSGDRKFVCKDCTHKFIDPFASTPLSATTVLEPENKTRGIRADKKAKAQSLLLTPGYTVRRVVKETGLSQMAVRGYKKGLVIPPCPCGRLAGHKGWCSFRYDNSPERQAWMKLIPRRAAVPDYSRITFMFQGPSLHLDSSIGTRCSEKGCPFPVVGKDIDLCPYHIRFYSQDESGTDSGMDWQDLHSEDTRVSPLRVATRWEMENYEKVIR